MTDAIERAARALMDFVEPRGSPRAWGIEHAMLRAKAALASLRPGDRITLADGTECWMAPMEPTPAMRAAAVAADDRRTGNETCAHIFRAMRDACKEDEG